jgi:REP element-mobilizing transposase RayT
MRRAKVAVFIHFVWATWDRLPLLQGSVQEQVYRAIGAKCEELGAEIVALGGVEDHVHLLIGAPATVSIAELIRQIKGASSHLIAQKVLVPSGAFFRWQGAYGAFSVSPQHLREVADYILHQREHHALGALKAEWEYPVEEKEDGG